MKITTTTTIIECNADELRQSNDLSDGFSNLLRKCFNGPLRATSYYDGESDEEPVEEPETAD